jgi:hypothetical protein
MLLLGIALEALQVYIVALQVEAVQELLAHLLAQAQDIRHQAVVLQHLIQIMFILEILQEILSAPPHIQDILIAFARGDLEIQVQALDTNGAAKTLPVRQA